MTIAQMESTRTEIGDKQIGLGHLDKEIVNFLIDDDDVLAKTRDAVFDKIKKPKVEGSTSYDYMFQKRSPSFFFPRNRSLSFSLCMLASVRTRIPLKSFVAI